MKKTILILSCIAVGLFSGCYKSDNDAVHIDIETEMSYNTLNNIIKDIDFHVAKIENGNILLYNEKYELISEIPFEFYENTKFIYARKDGPVIHFVTSIEADDERGIMFVNNESDGVLSGLNRVTRIGEDSYKFSTMM